jgi:hypothetical protein
MEVLLDQARTAAQAADEALATERLDEVEGLLRQHAELPQAAWLMAEGLRIRANLLAARPDGSGAAQALVGRAERLEGPRAPSFTAPLVPSTVDQSAPHAFVELAGVYPSDVLYADGSVVGAPLRAEAGEHHFRVVRGGRLVWAGWLELGASAGRVTLPVPPPAACSHEDFAGVRAEGDRVIVPASTACPRWVVARAGQSARRAATANETGKSDGIDVAFCQRASCGRLAFWRQEDRPAPSHRAPVRDESAGFPTWLSWTLAGVGALGVGTLVAWQLGAFDADEEPQRVFDFMGPPARP